MTDSVRLYETRDGWDRLTDVVTAYVSARVEPGGNDSPRDIVLYAIAGVRQREAERLEQLEAECRGLHAQPQEARDADARLLDDLEMALREPCAPNDRLRARGMLMELRRLLSRSVS